MIKFRVQSAGAKGALKTNVHRCCSLGPTFPMTSLLPSDESFCHSKISVSKYE